MPKFLIDANLPYYFSVWKGDKFIHQFELGDTWSDERIWDYASENDLTIVTKDADFTNKLMISHSPPKVIHLKIGNMKLNELHEFISRVWDDIVELNKGHKLVRVYEDRFETIEG